MVSKKSLLRKVQNSTDLKATTWAAYKAGLEEGRAERSAFLSQLQIVNHELWERLLELDQTTPVNGISISRDLAEKIVDTVKAEHPIIAKQVRRQIRLVDRHLKKVLKILNSCKLEK